MPRIARIVVPEVPHHITQRGNNQQDVFFVDDDREVYLELLKRQAEKYGLDVLGYCLMSNHVHLIATPQQADSLANAVGRTHFLYTQYINRMHGRSGHLWQGRFYSCALDESHFWAAMRYIECNPVRAKICRFPWVYLWSSAAAHTGKADGAELLNLSRWQDIVSEKEWTALLRQALDEQEIKTLHSNTQQGRPLGSDRFISKLEFALGRRLRPLPVGRPKKKTIAVKVKRKQQK